MIYLEQADFSVLTEKISNLQGALLGRGASDGQLQMFLRAEAGQTAWDIAQALGPGSLGAATERLDKDMAGVFTVKPRYSIFEDPERQGYSSTADFTWLTAGPGYLQGINDEDDQRGASGEDALALYKSARGLASRGPAQEKLGQRGKQAIMRINRALISSAAWNSVRRSVREKFGQMKASFARPAAELIPSKRIPEWIRKQFGAVVANGKSIFVDQSRQSPAAGFVEIGSRAPGVVNNEKVNAKIKGAIRGRVAITKKKLENVLNGFAYDWNTGRVFRSPSDDDNSNN